LDVGGRGIVAAAHSSSFTHERRGCATIAAMQIFDRRTSPPHLVAFALAALVACNDAPARTEAAAPAVQQASGAPAVPGAGEVTLSPPLVVAAVAAATGVAAPERSDDGVVKVSVPRTDVAVAVDGTPLPPFLGLTSWAAFSPGRAGVAEAMVMGDLVLFEDEVNPVMSELLAADLQVTALHNHFFYDKPAVYFMHIAGEGTVAALGDGVKRAMATVTTLRAASAVPATGFGGPSLPAPRAASSPSPWPA